MRVTCHVNLFKSDNIFMRVTCHLNLFKSDNIFMRVTSTYSSQTKQHYCLSFWSYFGSVLQNLRRASLSKLDQFKANLCFAFVNLQQPAILGRWFISVPQLVQVRLNSIAVSVFEVILGQFHRIWDEHWDQLANLCFISVNSQNPAILSLVSFQFTCSETWVYASWVILVPHLQQLAIF